MRPRFSFAIPSLRCSLAQSSPTRTVRPTRYIRSARVRTGWEINVAPIPGPKTGRWQCWFVFITGYAQTMLARRSARGNDRARRGARDSRFSRHKSPQSRAKKKSRSTYPRACPPQSCLTGSRRSPHWRLARHPILRRFNLCRFNG